MPVTLHKETGLHTPTQGSNPALSSSTAAEKLQIEAEELQIATRDTGTALDRDGRTLDRGAAPPATPQPARPKPRLLGRSAQPRAARTVRAFVNVSSISASASLRRVIAPPTPNRAPASSSTAVRITMLSDAAPFGEIHPIAPE